MAEFLAVSLVVLGCVLRAVQFRAVSLPWPGEASLYRMIELGWADLLYNPLDYSQLDAPGFLVATKLAYQAFGPFEFSVRALPFASSLIGLYLTWLVARYLLSPRWVPIIVGLFALNPIFILYASTPASFPVDLLVALAVLLAVLRMRESGFRPRAIGATAAIGAIGLFFSHYALLSLVGLWVAVGLMARETHDRATLRAWVSLGMIWALLALASFGLGSPRVEHEATETPRLAHVDIRGNI